MSDGGPLASSSRPYQNWTTAEQCHLSLRFRQMPSVYCSDPFQPGGVTSGQRFGPSRRSKSTLIDQGVNTTLVILAPTGQLPISTGLSWNTACSGSSVCGLNERVFENGVVIEFESSIVRACQ